MLDWTKRWMLACALSGLAASACFGVEDPGSVYYGQGVHAYFAGQYDQAQELLTLAIETNGTDPRPYYYRGLLFSHAGDPEAAKADFRRGGELEAPSDAPVMGIGNALQRIQGPIRLELERQRQLAKFAAIQPPVEEAESAQNIEPPALMAAPTELLLEPDDDIFDGPPSGMPEVLRPDALMNRGGR